MSTLTQDLAFALRSLRRRRAFTTVAITTIALGIGAATAIFSVIDGVLFRPLPFRESHRLIAVWQTYPRWRGDAILDKSWDRISLSIPEYRDWHATQRAFVDVAIWSTRGGVMIGSSDNPESISLMRASASMLRVLELSPVLGRYFTEDEDQLGAPPVTVLSYEAWESRYQKDPAIVGKSVTFDQQSYTIIGVLPPNLSLFRVNSATSRPGFWVPTGQDQQDANNRGNHSYQAVGRLRPGVTVAQATAETERVLRGDRKPEEVGVRLDDWQMDQTRTVRQPLFILLGAVALLLVVSCVNVAILLLGEATAREQEIAARMALGAGRGRIIRQLLTESVVLAASGGVLGSLLAWLGTRGLVALAPPRIPGLPDVAMDGRVLAFALAVSLTTGVLFGLAPAVGLSRSALGAVFRAGTGQSVAGRGRLQQVLIATEIGLSLVLLVGASLLGRSLARMTAVDPGFRADHLLMVRVSLPNWKYTDTTMVREFQRAAIARLSAVPGVARVTGSSNPPFAGGNSSSSLEIEGKPTGPGEPLHEAEQRTVIPGYFEAMQIPMIVGRGFGPEDRTGGALVVVVSQLLAQREWPNESAIGRRVKFQGAWREIVGVAGDTRFSRLNADVQAMIYVPFTQRPWSNIAFLVRSSVDPASLGPAVRRAIRDVDPAMPVLTTDTMEELIRRSSVEERYRTTLVSLFGVMAGILAAIGMYGVALRAATRRTREVGIRIALGARSAGIIRLLVTAAMGGVAAGIAVGVTGGIFAGRWLAPYLFGVTPGDRWSFIGSGLLLAGMSLLATWVPARRAARVPPAIVLRAE